MRKLISTAIVFGISGLLLGCPAPSKTSKTKTGAKTDSAAKSDSAAKTGEAAKTEDEGEGEGEEVKTEAASGGATKIDLSHVKKGQTYTYEAEASGTKYSMKYVVTDVTDTSVTYDMVTVMMGNESKQEGQKWEIPAAAATDTTATPATDVKQTKESVDAGGRSWDCFVTESNGTKSWTVMTFPGLIKTEGPSNKMALTTIE